MAYKDKDKQRTTTRERVRRYRAKLKGVTHKPKRNAQDVTPVVSPKPISNRGVLTLAAGGWLGPLTKEKQTSRKGFNE